MLGGGGGGWGVRGIVTVVRRSVEFLSFPLPPSPLKIPGCESVSVLFGNVWCQCVTCGLVHPLISFGC